MGRGGRSITATADDLDTAKLCEIYLNLPDEILIAIAFLKKLPFRGRKG
jgi:hypothetical protein